MTIISSLNGRRRHEFQHGGGRPDGRPRYLRARDDDGVRHSALLFIFWASAENWAVLAIFGPTRCSCVPPPLPILPLVLDRTVPMTSGWTVNEIPSTRSVSEMPSPVHPLFPVAAAVTAFPPPSAGY